MGRREWERMRRMGRREWERMGRREWERMKRMGRRGWERVGRSERMGRRRSGQRMKNSLTNSNCLFTCSLLWSPPPYLVKEAVGPTRCLSRL